MKTYIFIIFSLLLYISVTRSYSQNCVFREMDYYVIDLQVAKIGEPYDIGVLLIEDLNNLLIDKTSKESFVCSIYSNTSYLLPPPFDFERNVLNCYPDSSNLFYTNCISLLHQGLREMGKSFYTREFHLKDGSLVEICVLKQKALYCEFLTKEHNINGPSQVFIPDICYTNEHFYSILEFIEIRKLIKEEKRIIDDIVD